MPHPVSLSLPQTVGQIKYIPTWEITMEKLLILLPRCTCTGSIPNLLHPLFEGATVASLLLLLLLEKRQEWEQVERITGKKLFL
jgi:hypothetical protein